MPTVPPLLAVALLSALSATAHAHEVTASWAEVERKVTVADGETVEIAWDDPLPTWAKGKLDRHVRLGVTASATAADAETPAGFRFELVVTKVHGKRLEVERLPILTPQPGQVAEFVNGIEAADGNHGKLRVVIHADRPATSSEAPLP